jgi:hypothetical protein
MSDTLNALLSANRSSSRMIAGMNNRSRLPVGHLLAYYTFFASRALPWHFGQSARAAGVKWLAFDEEEEHASRQFNRRHS